MAPTMIEFRRERAVVLAALASWMIWVRSTLWARISCCCAVVSESSRLTLRRLRLVELDHEQEALVEGEARLVQRLGVTSIRCWSVLSRTLKLSILLA